MNRTIPLPAQSKAWAIPALRFFVAAVFCAVLLLPGALCAAGTTAYSYDTLHRLSRVTYPDGRQVTYSYDDMDNVVSVAVLTGAAPAVFIDEAIVGAGGAPIADYQIKDDRPEDVTG